MYDDENEIEGDDFKIDAENDELFDMSDDKAGFGLDEEDPDKDS